ncbi:CAP domain-containing protein [uncultured Secundilactobacillus sp.]|uniref:CAP domain-containing protein n=1 Tax=uncultured Secundilactobacillus sp. TaxID=2813935 RepID=UPI00258C2F1B|nr:CAP domain-containing protein [uncultured Secundilactobacillus sp.]
MKLTQLFAVTTATLGLGLATISVTQTATASAKVHASKLVSYRPYTSHYVTGSRGFMYTSPTLTKRAHHLTNYKHTTFIANRQAVIKRPNGKHAIYTYIRTSNFKVGGWVWHGFLKNKHVVTTKPETGTTTPSKGGSTSNGSQTTPKTQKFSLAEYRASFLKYLNEERTKRGLIPVSEDAQLDTLAQRRAGDLPTSFSHYDGGHNIIASKYADEMGITWLSEDIARYESASQTTDSDGKVTQDTEKFTGDEVAKSDVQNYIYYDASSNWGHRDSLLNPRHTKIGTGIVVKNSSYFSAAEFS